MDQTTKSPFEKGYDKGLTEGYEMGFNQAIDEIDSQVHNLCNIRQVLELLEDMRQ